MRTLNMIRVLFALIVIGGALLSAQESATAAQDPAPGAPSATAYRPKFAGDQAQSEQEFGALGYMRTVVAAQRAYYRKHNKYADSLNSLVGSLSFTRRMVATNRGDYTVSFRPKPEGYTLALTPRQYDAAHRAFYVDETGDFRAETAKPATKASPMLGK
jgi:hypothetical protein